MNGILWGTADETGTITDAVATTPSACGGGTANYPTNLEVCNGVLNDTVNDAGSVTSLAAYPRQPFNFAGRTGTIAFNVSDNSQGPHAAWPELWVTDQPVPDPFTHEASWQGQPRNGFGIRFAGCSNAAGQGATCPDGSPTGVGVDSAAVVNNYVMQDTFTGTNTTMKLVGDPSNDMREPTGFGQLNHIEVQVSNSQITVYGTNAFSGTWNPVADPLKLLATITGINLGFSQGLVWLEDVHYNGNKFNTQRINTFQWSDVGFDGPVEPRDLGFDVPNNNVPDGNVGGNGLPGFDNAYQVPQGSSVALTAPGVTQADINAASGALLVFNFYSESVIPLNVAINGNNVSEPWPYPDQTDFSPRPVAIPIPLSDVTVGNNTMTFSAASGVVESVDNIDLILLGAGGVVNP
jgi:hypothetical protein